MAAPSCAGSVCSPPKVIRIENQTAEPAQKPESLHQSHRSPLPPASIHPSIHPATSFTRRGESAATRKQLEKSISPVIEFTLSLEQNQRQQHLITGTEELPKQKAANI